MVTSLPADYTSWSDVPDALVPVQKVTGKRSQASLPAFVKGPLYLNWLSAIAETGSPPAIWVALALKVQGDRRREEWVSPPSGILAKFGVKRSSLSRAFQALEVAGVIEVQRRKGRPPLVRLLPWKLGDG